MTLVNLNYDNLVNLIKSYGYDDFTSEMVADYIDECVDYELDFNQWIWNVLPFNVVIIKGDKEDAIKYFNEHIGGNIEDTTIYVSDFLGGVYLEYD